MQNEGAVEAIMQLLSLLTAQYPVVVEVDDSMTALVEVTDVLLRAGTASVEGDPNLYLRQRLSGVLPPKEQSAHKSPRKLAA